MIVLDSSAVVAILTKEAEGREFLSTIRIADEAIISTVNVHECGIVLRTRLGRGGVVDLFDLLEALDIRVAPFGLDDTRLALSAFERYGKGMRSRAQLNLCDCVAYALAMSRDAPLLFKGNDFIHTDVKRLL